MKTFLVLKVFFLYLPPVNPWMQMTQKEYIIEQAAQMFVTQGIKAVRMDDIAGRLGVSKRTLYELFGDKEGLLYLALEHYFWSEDGRRVKMSAGADNVLDRMFMVLNDVLDNSERTSRLLGNLHKFYPSVHARLIREGNEQHRAGFRDMLEQGRAEGLFVDYIHVDLVLSVFWAMAGLTARGGGEFKLPEGVSGREAFVMIIVNFMRGISTVKGVQLIDGYIRRYGFTPPGVLGGAKKRADDPMRGGEERTATIRSAEEANKNW